MKNLRIILLSVSVILLLSLAYLAVPIIQGNNRMLVTDKMDASTVVASFIIEEVDLPHPLRVTQEFEELFYEDMSASASYFLGIDDLFPPVRSEKGLLIELRGLSIRENYVFNQFPDKEFCINSIQIQPTTQATSILYRQAAEIIDSQGVLYSPSLTPILTYDLSEKLCPTPRGNITFQDAKLGVIPLWTHLDSYYYPLDSHELSFSLRLQVQLTEPSTVDEWIMLAPNITLIPRYKNWDTSIEVVEDSWAWDITGIEETDVTLELRRPLTMQVLIPLLLLAFLFVICWLIRVDDTSSFLEVAIGILIGLWGIQSVLIPKTIESPTIIDPLILVLYVLLALIILAQFVIKPLWKRLGQSPSNQLDIEEESQATVSINPDSLAELKRIIETSRTNENLHLKSSTIGIISIFAVVFTTLIFVLISKVKAALRRK